MHLISLINSAATTAPRHQPPRGNGCAGAASPRTGSRRRGTAWRLLGLLLIAAPALADWHGSIAFLSDYQYRGYTKSRSNPVVQGNLDYEHPSGWFAGATLSQVSFDDKPNANRANFEARPYVGWAVNPVEDWRADLSVYGYLYDGQVFGQSIDYAEIYGSVTYGGWLTGRISLAPDAYQQHSDVFNYEATARHELLDNLQISVGLGFHQAGDILHSDYFYWNAGATWYPLHYLAVDMRYSDAQTAGPHGDEKFSPDEFYPRPLENKWLLSVTLGF